MKQQNIHWIIEECGKNHLGIAQIAYILGTVEHETARTFEPVREAFWRTELWRKDNLRYFPYYGRGFVQLTWKVNYLAYSHILGLVGTPDDLVTNPDVALSVPVATFILVHGFKKGTFTGKAIGSYISQDNKNIDFINARQVINGLDRAKDIARLAQLWYAKLK